MKQRHRRALRSRARQARARRRWCLKVADLIVATLTPPDVRWFTLNGH